MSLFELVGLDGVAVRTLTDVVAVSDGVKEMSYGELLPRVAERAAALRREESAGFIRIGPQRTLETITTMLAAFEARVPFEVDPTLGGQSTAAPEPSWPTGVDVSGWPAYVMATSGSSGAAKRTLVTRRGLRTVFGGLRERLSDRIPQGAIWTQVHPLTFGFSICEILGSIAFSGTLRLVDRDDALSRFADVVDGHDQVVSCLTPSELNLLCDHHDALPSHVLLSGEPFHRLSRPTMDAVSRAAGTLVVNTFATTETSGQVTAHVVEPGQWESARDGYAGEALPGVDVQIVDDAGQPVPPTDTRSVGEIVVLGDSIAAGYLHDRELNSERFGSLPRRWYRTGDRGRWSEGHGFFVLGRATRTVKVGGLWVDLDELERCLLALMDIRDVVVFLDEQTDSAEASHSVIRVVCEGSEASAARTARQAIADMFEQPVRVRVDVVPVIGRSPNGKVDRSSAENDRLRPETRSMSDLVLDAWREVLGDGIDPTTDVFAAGLDSLGVIAFTKRIEAGVGTRMPIRFVFDHPRVDDQVRYLESGGPRSVRVRHNARPLAGSRPERRRQARQRMKEMD